MTWDFTGVYEINGDLYVASNIDLAVALYVVRMGDLDAEELGESGRRSPDHYKEHISYIKRSRAVKEA